MLETNPLDDLHHRLEQAGFDDIWVTYEAKGHGLMAFANVGGMRHALYLGDGSAEEEPSAICRTFIIWRSQLVSVPYPLHRREEAGQ